MNKILSIVIPVYNVERYLQQCLQSIIGQITSRSDVEIIVVNDGSPDNSEFIINNFKEKYLDLIKVIKQENQGLSIARNNGLERAIGDYVWFVDSDDWLPGDAINNVLNQINSNNDVDVFSSLLSYYYEDKDTMKSNNYSGDLFFSGIEYIKKKLPNGASVRFIYKRSFLNDNRLRFLPNLLHEDAFWGYMMLYKATKVKFIEKPIYIYRIRNSGSIMSSISIRSAYDLIEGHKYLCAWMKKNVKLEDKIIFQQAIFGLIKTLLDFTKGLTNTSEYKKFLKENRAYIKKQAVDVLRIKLINVSSLIIAISPLLFSKICHIYNKIR